VTTPACSEGYSY